jgi:hypothetical protein
MCAFAAQYTGTGGIGAAVIRVDGKETGGIGAYKGLSASNIGDKLTKMIEWSLTQPEERAALKKPGKECNGTAKRQTMAQ